MKIEKYIWAAMVLVLVCLHACNDKKSTKESSLADTAAAAVPDHTDPEQNVPPVPSAPITGIDVSHFQEKVNWEEIKSAGIDFAYYKATQGSKEVDPEYHINREGARNSGIYHGAYHFYVAADDAAAQAKHFIQQVFPWSSNTHLPPVLDVEQGSVTNATKPDKFAQDVLLWLTEVEKATGVKPIIYTNKPFGDEFLNHPDFSNYQLWVAEYGVKEPRLPKMWSKKGWLMWQRSERGKVEGAVGNVDHDIFNGDVALFQQLIIQTDGTKN